MEANDAVAAGFSGPDDLNINYTWPAAAADLESDLSTNLARLVVSFRKAVVLAERAKMMEEYERRSEVSPKSDDDAAVDMAVRNKRSSYFPGGGSCGVMDMDFPSFYNPKSGNTGGPGSNFYNRPACHKTRSVAYPGFPDSDQERIDSLLQQQVDIVSRMEGVHSLHQVAQVHAQYVEVNRAVMSASEQIEGVQFDSGAFVKQVRSNVDAAAPLIREFQFATMELELMFLDASGADSKYFAFVNRPAFE